MTTGRLVAVGVSVTLALAWLMGREEERYEAQNRPLPELALASLDGEPLAPGHFDGRPWLINVWLPG